VIRTPDQRVRVFVSSTLGELAAERRAVTAAITQLRLTPVLFELGARPYPPRDLYRAYLKQSDVFVGIYGESYGQVAPGMEISGLEDEYRLSADKPRLIYTKKAARREPRLTTFLEAIQAEGVVSYRHFKDADELASLVADDLALLLTERFVSSPAPPPAAPLPAPRWPLVDRAEELRVVTGLLRQADIRLGHADRAGWRRQDHPRPRGRARRRGPVRRRRRVRLARDADRYWPDLRHGGPAASHPDLARPDA